MFCLNIKDLGRKSYRAVFGTETFYKNSTDNVPCLVTPSFVILSVQNLNFSSRPTFLLKQSQNGFPRFAVSYAFKHVFILICKDSSISLSKLIKTLLDIIQKTHGIS